MLYAVYETSVTQPARQAKCRPRQESSLWRQRGAVHVTADKCRITHRRPTIDERDLSGELRNDHNGMGIWFSGPGPEFLRPGLGFAVEKDSRPAYSEIGGILKGRQRLSWRFLAISRWRGRLLGFLGWGDIGSEATGVGLRRLFERSERLLDDVLLFHDRQIVIEGFVDETRRRADRADSASRSRCRRILSTTRRSSMKETTFISAPQSGQLKGSDSHIFAMSRRHWGGFA